MKLFISLLFCIAFFSASSQTAVECAQGRQLIGTRVEYFNDSTSKLTISDFLKSTGYPFQLSSQETLNLGSSVSPIWLRFSYYTQDSLQHFLEVKNSTLQELDFYVVNNGGEIIVKQYEGLQRNKSSKGRSVFWLFELPNSQRHQPYTVYLRISDFRRVILPLYVTDIQSTFSSDTRTNFGFGIYFGFLFLIAFANIIVFILFKEKIYLLYVLHIVIQILINGVLKGYLLELTGPTFLWLGSYIPFMAAASSLVAIAFSILFLDLKQGYPMLLKLSWAFCVFPAAVIILNLTQQFYLSSLISTYSSMLICLWLFVLGLIVYLSQHATQVRFYLASWTFFFVGLFTLNLALNNWIAVNSFTLNAAIYGSVFEVMLLAFALVDRVSILRKAHESERQRRLQLTEKHNAILEKRVAKRTVELAQKNVEIAAQNEELTQQHEELLSINDVLEEQNKLVEIQKREIEGVNIILENKVQERTFQLEQTVKDLIKQNHDLEQFSYIISHNLRAPVARMMGLISLFELRDREDLAYEAQLQAYMKDSALGLDQIIQDLKQIIDMRKGLHTIIEEVRTQHIVNHVLIDLDGEINKSKARVTTTLDVERMVTIKPYLQSIVYNLLSNSLKYRSADRNPEINLTITSCDEHVSIRVKDNGLGIDLPPNRISEIFNLYKRMHVHVEGKGLGLYLVKTQVESLQGSVSVESKVDEGTLVIVKLPKQIE